MGEKPWSKPSTVLTILLVVGLAFAAVNFVLMLVLNGDLWIPDPACNTYKTCVHDVSSWASGVKICDHINASTGERCDSACHVSGTATKCTYDQQCTHADVTTCLGYCEMTTSDSSIVQGEHPDCDEDKIAFKDFSSWNTELSSANKNNWLYYSDVVPGDCYGATLGCTWYGAYVQLVASISSPDFWEIGTVTPFTCTDFLNMTNSQCIHALEIPLDENISTPLFKAALSVTTFKYQGTACIYYYQCAKVLNETALTDPIYLQGAKRSLPSSPPPQAHIMERFVERMQAREPDIRRQWEPRLQQFQEDHEERKRVIQEAFEL
jgi:hypothetical protein